MGNSKYSKLVSGLKTADTNKKWGTFETNAPTVPGTWLANRCGVCGHTEDHDSNMLLTCDGCGATAHQNCYGKSSSLPRADGSWLCRACAYHEVRENAAAEAAERLAQLNMARQEALQARRDALAAKIAATKKKAAGQANGSGGPVGGAGGAGLGPLARPPKRVRVAGPAGDPKLRQSLLAQSKVPAKPRCVLCPVEGGVLKPTTLRDTWAHVLCTLWVPETVVVDPDEVEPMDRIQYVHRDRWGLKCTVCNCRHGACIQCHAPNCFASYHASCAFLAGLPMEVKSVRRPKPPKTKTAAANAAAAVSLLVPLGDTVTGRTFEIYFDGDGVWYTATCLRADPLNHRWEVLYECDGVKEVLDATKADKQEFPPVKLVPLGGGEGVEGDADSSDEDAMDVDVDAPGASSEGRGTPAAPYVLAAAGFAVPAEGGACEQPARGKSKGKGKGRKNTVVRLHPDDDMEEIVELVSYCPRHAHLGSVPKDGVATGGIVSFCGAEGAAAVGGAALLKGASAAAEHTLRTIATGALADAKARLVASVEPNMLDTYPMEVQEEETGEHAARCFPWGRRGRGRVRPWAGEERWQRQSAPYIVGGLGPHSMKEKAATLSGIAPRLAKVAAAAAAATAAVGGEAPRGPRPPEEVLRPHQESGLAPSARLSKASEEGMDRVTFGKSRIHKYGAFAKRKIKRGEIVAEYKGEYVRVAVANARERKYRAKDIDCYLFRVGEDVVIDGTMKGCGCSRQINASCEPNMFARIVDSESGRRVVFNALRDIEAGQEVTYDYRFDEEDSDAKVACYCGSERCRGTLN